MSFSRLSGFFVCLLALTACATVPQTAAVTQAVQARERVWLDAYEARDVKAMAGVLHPNFVITYPDGSSQNRDDVLAFIERESGSGKKGPHFFTEGKAHPGRGVVVLTGLVTTERTTDAGLQRKVQRYTDTWVLEEGRWQVLASHLADLK